MHKFVARMVVVCLVFAGTLACGEGPECTTPCEQNAVTAAQTPGGCYPYCEGEVPDEELVLVSTLNGRWSGLSDMWAEGDRRASARIETAVAASGSRAQVTPLCTGSGAVVFSAVSARDASWSGAQTCQIPAYGCDAGTYTAATAVLNYYSEGTINVRSSGTWTGCGRTVAAEVVFFGGQRMQ